MSPRTFLLYGANGYTGELIAEEAARRGWRPVLAGRRAGAVRPVAERLGLEARIFALEDPAVIVRHLEGVEAVLLAAGPFSATSRPMIEACLQARRHYLDITGEIEVLEASIARAAEARAAGVAVLSGSGFDVVPTDCLAASLSAALPGSTSLELAFAGGGGLSRGTRKTMLAGAGKGGAVRENGRIRRVPMAYRTATIPFRDRSRPAVSIPWGDVSTAYHSTGIPNVVVYVALPERTIRSLRWKRVFAPLLALGPVQAFLRRRIDRSARGPGEEVRRTRRMQLWGRASDATGRSVEGTLETPEAYELTALTALECARRILDGKVAPGAHTPARAFGAGFISEIPGCDLRIGPARSA